jgi:hypothetical protein
MNGGDNKRFGTIIVIILGAIGIATAIYKVSASVTKLESCSEHNTIEIQRVDKRVDIVQDTWKESLIEVKDDIKDNNKLLIEIIRQMKH